MSRPITIIGLLQVLVIILGFVLLGTHMKYLGYPQSETVRWTTVAVLLREYGAFLLLVPLGWMIYASLAFRRDRGWLSYQPAILAGVALIVLLLGGLLYTGMRPASRMLIIGQLPPSSGKNESEAAANR